MPIKLVRRNACAAGFAGIVLLCLICGPAGPGALAQTSPDDPGGPTPRQIERRGDLVSIISGDIHVPADVRQRGMIFCLGGDVLVEGHVTQDVVAVLGSVTVTGSVGGTVTTVLASQELRHAQVGADSVNVLGSLEIVDSEIGQNLVNVLGSLDKDTLSKARGQIVNIGLGGWAPSVWAALFWVRMFHKFVVFVLLLLVVALVPERIRYLGDEAPVRFVAAFFIGLLGYLGYLILLTLLSVTVVGIPLLWIGFVVLKWMGIAGIFHAVGRRLGRALGMEMSTLGATLLVFGLYVAAFMVPAAFGIFGLFALPVLKLLFFLLIEVPAVGLVILTVAGREPKPLSVGAPRPPAPPVPAAPAPPAAPPEAAAADETGSPPRESG